MEENIGFYSVQVKEISVADSTQYTFHEAISIEIADPCRYCQSKLKEIEVRVEDFNYSQSTISLAWDPFTPFAGDLEVVTDLDCVNHCVTYVDVVEISLNSTSSTKVYDFVPEEVIELDMTRRTASIEIENSQLEATSDFVFDVHFVEFVEVRSYGLYEFDY